MANHAAVSKSKETPMERIFFKVTGRKMTPGERAAFQLTDQSKPSPRNAAQGGAARKDRRRN
ncbi:MAG: hypothetical protein LAO19_20595 [Acidobacteriia bacterium]|nr:hypothetical protein [Terriglobia bacterium]